MSVSGVEVKRVEAVIITSNSSKNKINSSNSNSNNTSSNYSNCSGNSSTRDLEC